MTQESQEPRSETVIKEIKTATARLQRILQHAITYSVLEHAAVSLFSLHFKAKHERLSAPVKQMFHLLGLMLVTPPERPKNLSAYQWDTIEKLVERVFFLYAHLFFSFTPNTPEYERLVETIGPAFLQYFQTFALYYEEQLRDRIRTWFTPFDYVIQRTLNLSVNELLAISASFKEQFQEHFNVIKSLEGRLKRMRDELMSEAQKNNWPPPKIRQIARQRDITTLAESYSTAMSSLFLVDRQRMAKQFGSQQTDRFLSLFSARRGSVSGYFFPTERNPAEWQPIFHLEDRSDPFCPLPWVVQEAVKRRLDQTIRDSPECDRFLKHRDRALEMQVFRCMRAFLPADAEHYLNFYETPNNEFEHDILFRLGNVFLIIETKASPPTEPFRDPHKSYTRLQHHFHSDRGIQKGYDQASRLRDCLQSDKDVRFYDSRGAVIVQVPAGAKRVFCIVATADSFGPISSDLTKFLKKKPEEPYPWVVDVFSLETFLEALAKKGRLFDDLVQFLEQRSLLQGKVFGNDELEYCGVFLREGDFRRIISQPIDRIFLASDTSRIFDEIYFANHGEVLPESSDKRLHLFDPKELLRNWADERLEPSGHEEQVPVVGRNDACPCGSGSKYKRCHGR